MKLNKKGFTLVELLAVIVILAVIMLVAITAVGPAITNSKKGAFFSSISAVQDAAVLYVASTGITSNTCINSATLVSKGFLQTKDSNFVADVKIIVSGSSHTYNITAKNADYYQAPTEITAISKDTDFAATKAITEFTASECTRIS